MRSMKFLKRGQVSAGASPWEYCGAEHVALGRHRKLLSQDSSRSRACSILSCNVAFLNFYHYGISYGKWLRCAKTGQVPLLPLIPDTAGGKFTCRTFLAQNNWIKAQQTSGDGDQFWGVLHKYLLFVFDKDKSRPHHSQENLKPQFHVWLQSNPQAGAVGSKKEPSNGSEGKSQGRNQTGEEIT